MEPNFFILSSFKVTLSEASPASLANLPYTDDANPVVLMMPVEPEKQSNSLILKPHVYCAIVMQKIVELKIRFKLTRWT